MRIAAGWRVSVQCPGNVRIGTGPGALLLRGLDAQQVEAVTRLARGEPLPLPRGDAAVLRRRELLERLAPVLVSGDPLQGMVGLAAERLRPDAQAWCLVPGSPAPGFLAERALRHVWISTLDRAGLQIALGLAAAGVGRLSTADQQPVIQQDLGASPLRLTELGLPRAAALARHLGRLYPQSCLLAPVRLGEASGADAAVVLVRDGLGEAAAAELGRAQLPVLTVLFHESGFRVGPWLGLAGGGCAACIVGSWPVLGGEEAAPRDRADTGPETGCSMTAAGLVVQALLPLLDGSGGAALLHGSYEVTLADGSVSHAPLPACTHLAAA